MRIYLNTKDFDGDALNGSSIKEMDIVPQLMSLHPMTTMLGGSRMMLNDNVRITQEARLACHTWLKENDLILGSERIQALNDKIKALQKELAVDKER